MQISVIIVVVGVVKVGGDEIRTSDWGVPGFTNAPECWVWCLVGDGSSFVGGSEVVLVDEVPLFGTFFGGREEVYVLGVKRVSTNMLGWDCWAWASWCF